MRSAGSGNYLKETVKERLNLGTIASEAIDAVAAKVGQGASEVASAIHTGNAFVQYGADQFPVQGGVHGPEATQEPPATEIPGNSPPGGGAEAFQVRLRRRPQAGLGPAGPRPEGHSRPKNRA